jgi:8-oxo-dGTP diphosphatase
MAGIVGPTDTGAERGRFMARRKFAWIKQHSAGGVVVRTNRGVAEYLAIMPAHRERWQLPKGTVDRGESVEQAARREVREEGGVEATIVGDLGPISFFYRMAGQRYAKTVNFFLMRYEGGDPSEHDHEVKEARWFRLGEPEHLAFPSERNLVIRARELVEQGLLNRAATSPSP